MAPPTGTGPSTGTAPPSGIGYFGPPGTFTEEALRSQADLAPARRVALPTIAEVLEAVEAGECELGFVPIENSIEGTVTATLDALVFDLDLVIRREVMLDVHLNLLAPPGTLLGDVRTVVSFPHASAQCRGWLSAALPGVRVAAAASTADAARVLGEQRTPGTAALAPLQAAALYGLEVLAESVEDHAGNQTRFVLVGREGVPGPSGHDRTSVACFQHVDRSGTLHAILGQFAARDINLTKIESRPTKAGMGQYCFIIDLEGHIADELVGDCLRDLHASLAEVKFLGSYPAAGADGPGRRRDADAGWRAAASWLEAIRGQIGKG
ncbi:MAG: prephenate dehydratase [Acidimicrobiales bacterium]